MITGTSAQLKPVKSLRSCRPRSGKPSARTRLLLHDPSPLACSSRRRRRSSPAAAPGRACGSHERSGSLEPSAWMRRKSAAPARFAIRARAMFPMLVPAVLVRVITTRMPARSSRGRSRAATRMFSSASVNPDTTPCVPPPSLILRVDEPGPIGSVSAFPRRSWPGVDDDDRGLRRLRSRDQQEERRPARVTRLQHDQRTTNETATNWDTAAARTRTWKTSWKPNVAGNGSGQCVAYAIAPRV